MRTYYIYKYTNLAINKTTNEINNKIYVGQCFNIDQRRRAHKSAALKNSDACPLFYRAIRHYGYESFKFEIIEKIFTDQAGIDNREIYWIKKLNARDTDIGYNLSPGGGGRANPNNTDTHKQCPRCDEIKLRTEYTFDICRHDGIRFCCKPCGYKIDREYLESLSDEEMERRNKIRRENYAANPDKQIEQSKKYYSEHKEERAEYKKAYNEENAEIIAVKNHERYIENAEDRKKYAKEEREKLKEENSKLTKEQIYTRTPIKFCNDECQKDLSSVNFYTDLTRTDALANRCKDCHKSAMVRNRAKNKAAV